MLYLTVACCWFLYFLIHSGLASNQIKSMFKATHYRIFYNLVALVGLLIIAGFISFQTHQLLFPKTGFSQLLGLILATYGILILKKAFKQYSIKSFIGLGSKQEKSIFIRSGILHYIRHPIYTATILLILGYFVFSPSDLNLVSVLSILSYLFVGIRLEEQKLIAEFGESYIHYKEEVPMLFPKDFQFGKLLK